MCTITIYHIIYIDEINDTKNIFNEIEILMKIHTCNAFQFIKCKNYSSYNFYQ